MTVQQAIEKVINLAISELGYKEKASNAQLDDKTANAGPGNWTKYARDLDLVPDFYNGKKQGFAYCDVFHDWLHYKLWGADMAMRVLCQPKKSAGAGCKYSADYYKAAGQWRTTPQAGDQIFFANGSDVYHTGLVEKVVGNEVHCIEGNTSDMVARRVYNIDNGYIYGYGRPKWELLANVADQGTAKTEPISTAVTGTQTATYSPLVCMMTHSTCYKGTSKMTVKGVLWHSTGANNPWLKRYVQPDDNAANRNEILAKLGVNQYHNDWNHKEVYAGLNAWVGKLENGTVAAVQTMPWDYKPWGCGSGWSGSCNNGWIQFEICEDGLGDQSYFNAVYAEAVKLTAYLCKMYGINPFGKVGNIPTILCHADSYKLGMGTNHGDVYHWFNRYGKTMDDVRADVAKLLGTLIPASTSTTASSTNKYGNRELGRGDGGDDVKQLQKNLIAIGYSLPRYGADGDFGAETDSAVRKLQKDNGLKVDGIVGKNTYAVIENKLAKKSAPVAKKTYAVGDIVDFKGDKHYISANFPTPKVCKGGKAKITQIVTNGNPKHPYHLVATPGGGATVHGWVDSGTFEKV